MKKPKEALPPPAQSVELYSSAIINNQFGWESPPYARKTGALLYAQVGSCIYSCNGILYPLKAGECIWFPPDVTIGRLPIKGELFRTREFKISVHDPALAKMLQNLFPPITVDATLESMLSYLAKNWANRDAQNQRRIESFLTSILNLFLIDEVHYDQHESAFVADENFSPATKKILRFLEANIGVPFSLDLLSQRFGYNKNYLSTTFSRDTGYTIRDYHMFQRIRVATVYLFFWNVSVSVACERTYFNSLAHFSRVFRDFVGITPSKFHKCCVSLSTEDRNLIVRSEPLLSYRPMPIDELFASLRHFGETMAEVLKRKSL